jgi:hypothetical protein
MIFKPRQLSLAGLDGEALAADKKRCKRFGPCGVGEKALYLNSFYIDRCFYVVLSSVRRIFKRVAMSKGGFTGKGMFASIPYLVVEYDDGKRKQCNFKREEDVDRLLEYMARIRPDIPRLSEEGERRLAEKAAREASRYLKELTPQAQRTWDELEQAKAKLSKDPARSRRLARAARTKRNSDRSNPAYKWVALTIVILGAAALVYGVWTWLHQNGTGVYFLLFGMAAIFFFSGANVLPTAKNNRKAVAREWEEAKASMRELVGEAFPVPYWYAHPVVLERMVRIVREGRAQTAGEALEVLKADLKALNSSVQVEQEEYDEVVCIKPIFLLQEYK